MKKIISLLIVATMIFGVSVFAFADEATVCEVNPEFADRFLEIKTDFIEEKVADGTLDPEEAKVMLEALNTDTGNETLMGLGFGLWLRDSEYADEINGILPHKNMGTREYGQGNYERSGDCLEDGSHPHMTDEEFEARRAEGGFGQKTGGGRGHRNNQ